MSRTATIRSGLTLLETLVALGLLGLLASASFGWIAVTQRGLANAADATNWRRSADASLALLYEDLVSGDAEAWAAEPVRITWYKDAEIESLTFPTRVATVGPCMVAYRFDNTTGALTREIERDERLLIENIEHLRAVLIHEDLEQPDTDPIAIDVEIAGIGGQIRSRRIWLGAREVRQ